MRWSAPDRIRPAANFTWRGRAGTVGVLAIVSSVVAMLLWIGRVHRGECRGNGSPEPGEAVILASDVVFRPWMGRHHVYGIFHVPKRYDAPEYTVRLRVRGVDANAALAESLTRLPDNRAVDTSEYYVVYAPIMTRAALAVALRGRVHDLTDTCNWALIFSERNSKKTTTLVAPS